MRIQLLKDTLGASESQFQTHGLASVAANDDQPLISRLPNPAETYLMSLAAGSRRTMAQALGVVAKVIEPASTAATLDWTRVSYGDVARVRAALSERYSPNMANKVLAALRGVMKATFRLGLIDSDSLTRALDVRRVRGGRITRGRSLDTDEIARLIAVCDRTTAIGVRNAAIIAVGFCCGLRRAEIVALDVADVLENGAALRVRGKGNKERLVYTSNSTREHIAAWLQHRSNNPGALFCAANRSSVRVQRLNEQTVYDVLQSLATKAMVAHVSPHDLRRTFVCTLLDRGVALSTVSAMAGHADISTTARYDVRGERVKRAASELLDVAIPT